MARKIKPLALAILAIFASMAGTVTGAKPAHAFCIENRSTHKLRVHMETGNPFGKFRVLFKPGERSCCTWFTLRCNPTRARDGLLTFSIRSNDKYPNIKYCTTGWMRGAFATADGSIRITDSRSARGGLDCDSRDSLKRPVTQSTFVERRLKNRRGMPPPIIVPPSGR